MDWDGIVDNNNDEVDEDEVVKLMRQWLVGDGGNNGNSRGNGNKGRCNVGETVEDTTESTAEKMAVAKAMEAATVEAKARPTMASMAETTQRWRQM